MQTYVSKQGDTADYIAWKYYGNLNDGTVEAVLEANPGLADYGPEIPEGVTINLPEISSPITTQGVTLWD